MAERLKAHAWKACIGETLSRVRIPLSPPLRVPRLPELGDGFFQSFADEPLIGNTAAASTPFHGRQPQTHANPRRLFFELELDRAETREVILGEIGTGDKNLCLGEVWYWREQPLEIDAVFDGSWGKWAVEVKTGRFDVQALRGLLEFCCRNPAFKPLVISRPGDEETARRHGIKSIGWEDFLLYGPPKVEGRRL
jgi:hypothetical protein